MNRGRKDRSKPTQTATPPAQAALPNRGAAFPFPQHGQQFQAQVIQTNVLPPDVLKQFDALVPGSAKRLLELAYEETMSRRAQEERALSANIEAQQRQIGIAEYQSRSVFRSDMIGQVAGFLVCLACVGGAVYLGLTGAPWQIPVALAAIPTAAVIRAFKISPPGPKKDQAEPEKKA